MRTWVAVLGLAVGCAAESTGAEADLASLRELHVHHRETVQASFDMSEIGGFEEEYDLAWDGLAARVAEALGDCLHGPGTEMDAADWLDTLGASVDAHVGEYELHSSFLDCWTSEDDHHHDVMEGLDAADAAAAECGG